MLLDLFKTKVPRNTPNKQDLLDIHDARTTDFCTCTCDVPSIDADVKGALEQLQIVLDPVAKADCLEHAQKVCNSIRTVANGFLSRVLSLSFGADLLARTQEKFILMQNDLRNSQMLGQIQAGMSSKPNLNDLSSFEMKAHSQDTVAAKQRAEVSTTGKSIEKSSSERCLKESGLGNITRDRKSVV